MKRWVMGLNLLLSLGLGAPCAMAAELNVQVAGEKLTVHSAGAPLYGVLWAISAQTGIELSITDGLQTADVPVVDDFTALPVREGIMRLLQQPLQQINYSLVIHDKTGTVKAIHIISNTSHQPPSSIAAVLSAPEGEDQQPGKEENAAAEEMDADELLDRTIEAAWSATDPAAEIEALQKLADFQDPRTLEVLQSALHSDQAEVRRVGWARGQ